MKKFVPEGWLLYTLSNCEATASPASLREAWRAGTILEAKAVLCDKNHDLHIDLGCMKGIIPREEGAIGIAEGAVRDIALISRVNKPVVFQITGFETDAAGRPYALLSRRRVQQACTEEYVSTLRSGDVIDARVSHMESFGAFVDIGAGLSALIPVDSISVSRIPHPNQRFVNGEDIRAVVREIEGSRITLTHKELLGTWEQSAAQFHAGDTVGGIIRSIEPYGIFIELAPNLAGLAEHSEGYEPGQEASVYIKSIHPEKMKIKLILIDAFQAHYKRRPVVYYTDAEHIDRWIYSPESCPRVVETNFTENTDNPA